MDRFEETVSATEPMGLLAALAEPAPTGPVFQIGPAMDGASRVLACYGRRAAGIARAAGGRSSSRARLGRSGRRR
jgi:hypothetical protein